MKIVDDKIMRACLRAAMRLAQMRVIGRQIVMAMRDGAHLVYWPCDKGE